MCVCVLLNNFASVVVGYVYQPKVPTLESVLVRVVVWN